MRFCIFIILTILTSVTAFGRLGDTEEQLRDRYGKPILIRSGEKYNPYFNKWIDFNKEGIAISCGLHDGRCVQVKYEKNVGFKELEFEGFTLLNQSKSGIYVERTATSLQYTYKKDYPGIVAGSQRALRRMRKDYESTQSKG